jgi:FkbM family methyltransferase
MTMSLSADPPEVPPHYARENEFPPRLRFMRWLGRQSWIPRGVDRALRTLHHPDANRQYLFEVEFYGQRYRGNLASFIDWMVFCYGADAQYELTTLRLATEYLRARRPGPITFYDIGGNVGHHSLFMAALVDRILAFEPFATTRNIFEERIRFNNLQHIEVLPIALGEADEELTYYPGVGPNSGIGTFLNFNAPQRGITHTLPVRRGDTFFDERQFPKADIIKVDVEGFELHVFNGLKQRILRDRPIILTEMLEAASAVAGSEAALRSCFYDDAIMIEVSGRGNSPRVTMRPFRFGSSSEVLIVPPEMADFVSAHIRS